MKRSSRFTEIVADKEFGKKTKEFSHNLDVPSSRNEDLLYLLLNIPDISATCSLGSAGSLIFTVMIKDNPSLK